MEATMQPLMRATDFVDDWLGRLCRGMILVSMVILLGVIGLNVIARYVFSHGGINEVGEIPEIVFPWLISAGIILGVQRGSHIAVDFISGQLGERGKVAMLVFVNLVVILSYAILAGPVLEIAEITAIERTPLLGLPRSIGFYSVAFAIFGVIYASLAVIIRVIVRGMEAAPEFDPEESVT
jgi:TRAP-type C4-dicarboxylate transport system permease small subunit